MNILLQDIWRKYSVSIEIDIHVGGKCVAQAYSREWNQNHDNVANPRIGLT